MKKQVLVFIFDGYADYESVYICSELNKEESMYCVKTISFDKEAKISMGGFKIIPDYSIKDYPRDFAALLLMGGDAWIQKKNNDVKPLVEYALNHNILVGAICGATFFIGENGYLDNIKHTSNTLDFLKIQSPHYKGDKNYIEKQAVSDKRIITANGTAILEFAKEIMIILKTKPLNEINKWYEFNKKGFYEV